MCLYSILLGFTMELFNGNISLRNYRIDNAFPTFELEVHNVLTFSFGNDQYTRITNQKIATYVGQSSRTAEILFQGQKC